MAGEVTTGNQLNAYQGNANLASVPGSGYGKIDLSPLATYAAYAYNTHLEDFKQQQKDKAKIEELYMDPSIYLSLDKGYADQVAPLTSKIKNLGAQNLQLQPNSDKWYEFMDTYKELKSANAKLKTVQELKNKALTDAGASADVHEKERLTAYADKLDKYKLGEDVPAYDKYFKADETHIPTGLKSTGTRQKVLPNGNVQTEKFTVFNPIGLDTVAAQNLALHPEYAQTYSDIAHKYLEQGDLSIVNSANADTYDKSMLLNMDELRTKYKTDFAKYQKQFPGKTFGDFMTFNGKDNELQKVYQGNAFLQKQVQQVPATVDRGKELAGYTYYTDQKTGAKTRLNVPDSDLAAMMGATKNVPGERDEVVSEILGLTPKDKYEAGIKLQLERENRASAERINANTQEQENYRAGLKAYAEGKGKTVPELPMTPLPSILAGIGGYNKRVKISSLPISQVAAINPNWLDAKGNLLAANKDIEVTVGKRIDETDGVFIYKKGKKATEKESVNESKLKSNAESWLATFAKERKGQEVYGYIDDLYQKAKGNVVTPSAPANPTGLKEQGNIELDKQPSVYNPYTKGQSTVWSMSIGTDKGEVLISRVTPEGKVMSEKEAVDYYKKTGKHLGVFDTPEAATKYAKQLHDDYETGKIPTANKEDLRKKYDY